METHDAVMLEVLARSSQGEGFLKMAATPELTQSVRTRFQEAEKELDGCAVGGSYSDFDNRYPWQILYFPGKGIGVAQVGGGSFEHWSTKPDAILLEAFQLLPRFSLAMDRHRRASSSALLQAGAAAVHATGESLPLLPSMTKKEPVIAEVTQEEREEILAPSASELEVETNAQEEDTEAFVTALVEAVPEPSARYLLDAPLSEESRLAEELLGKMSAVHADVLVDDPLPPLKSARKKRTAEKG